MWWNVKPALPCIHLGRRLKDETGRDKKKCFVGGQWRAEILVGQPLGSLWPPPRDPRERSGGRSEHRIWRREGRCAGWYAVMRRLQGALRRTGALWGKGGGRENGEAGVEMGRAKLEARRERERGRRKQSRECNDLKQRIRQLPVQQRPLESPPPRVGWTRITMASVTLIKEEKIYAFTIKEQRRKARYEGVVNLYFKKQLFSSMKAKTSVTEHQRMETYI